MRHPPPFIVVVEDDTDICTLLRFNMERQGFEVEEAHDGEVGLDSIRHRKPDLVVLDWMLPRLSGLELCRVLRRSPQTSDIPIVMLTARQEEADKVRGLRTGADDYLSKPFSVAELMARIQNLLRRTRTTLSKGVIDAGALQIDRDKVKVTRNGRFIHLGPTEYKILLTLVGNPGHVFGRHELLDLVWGPQIYVEDRTVDVHIRRLRRALNGPDEADLIRTVRGTGYALSEQQ